jgi:hypothetical protein
VDPGSGKKSEKELASSYVTHKPRKLGQGSVWKTARDIRRLERLGKRKRRTDPQGDWREHRAIMEIESRIRASRESVLRAMARECEILQDSTIPSRKWWLSTRLVLALAQHGAFETWDEQHAWLRTRMSRTPEYLRRDRARLKEIRLRRIAEDPTFRADEAARLTAC